MTRTSHSLFDFKFAKCRFAECCFAECRFAAECRIAECPFNMSKKERRPLFLILYLIMEQQYCLYYLFIFSIPCSLFRRIVSIPHLSRIQNKEKKNACVLYSLIYKIDVTLGRRLRTLHVSVRTASVFTRITTLDDVSLGYLQRDIATSILLM